MSSKAPTIQDLLDEEARLGNAGKTEEQKGVHVLIKLRRGHLSPPCWGEDDCSTNMLMRCPWRIDCGSKLEE